MNNPSYRILIIDDDDPLRAMISQMLERAGYSILEAANGAKGLELCRAHPIDLIITDIIMPEKEGMETMIELRRDFPDIPVIAISGGGRTGTANYLPMARKLGARRTLSKPFSRDELLLAIREILAD